MSELICYCFNYTVDDIKADFKQHGKSLILEKITKEKNSTGVIVRIRIRKVDDALGTFTVS